MKNEIYDLTFELEENYWWYVARRRIILSQVGQILSSNNLASKPRILEYGCGTGKTLSCLSNRADVYGMDISPQALDYCRQRELHNLKLIDLSQNIDSDNPFSDPYDIILMLDVLEHIEDQKALLQNIKQWLKPGGVMLLTVPAYNFLWSGEDYVSNHLRRYTKSTLANVMQESGLHIERISYFNCFLLPLQAGTILLNRFFRPQTMQQTNLHTLSPGINTMLTSIMSAEIPLIKIVNLPFGGSILCTISNKSR
jgi:2-polyprenyl-3-methyl-5-hydroxy-6-metoxy-1,4-benzoquinol methylase